MQGLVESSIASKPDLIHFTHDGPPEIRKSFVLIVTTAARVVVQVVVVLHGTGS
jgi:hypothetical protein